MITVNELKASLSNGKIKKIILDTDTYNEIDDQFALAYAMLSTQVELLSVNAAPFFNNRSSSPADGMLKSYDEILRVMNLVPHTKEIPVYHGSTTYLLSKDTPVESDACDNIINTVMNSDETIYIVAIGAITNVASAIIKCPEITKRACLVWLGGNSLTFPNTKEFNMVQDIMSAQVVFDSGIPFVQIPCCGVCTEFHTTLPELEYYLRGKNKLCDYLVDSVSEYAPKVSEKNPDGAFAWSKVIWDVTAVGVLTVPKAFRTVLIPSPIITDNCRYAFDTARHHYVYVERISRDILYKDLFRKLISANN